MEGQREVSKNRLDSTYRTERPKLLARLRAAGKTLEEAEDLLHDIYVETLERLPVLHEIRNLAAWLNSLLGRRIIDAWRHQQVARNSGETDVAQETIDLVIAGAGLNPLDSWVRENLVGALHAAIRVLPVQQRKVVEAQVFHGKTFREISEETGVGVDTLTARKRYAIQNLSNALRHWIED